ncbi:MAG: glycoside hydrolase family 5 protein [Bacteroidales bacterium]|nr:glycoside hydrolase family 5 protein [Bacteroidales bacterium]
MNKYIRFTTILMFATFCIQNSTAQESRPWYQDGPWRFPAPNPKAKVLPLIKVDGNKLINSKGDTLLLRGLSISDPDKIERQGHWKKSHFEKVREMGAMIVRIPVHPVAWRERTPEKYLALLDQAVEWCTDLGMYIMIDWHSIGNLGMELFQNPMYNTSKQETYQFWRTIAQHFRGNNTIAFYEIFNEPTIYRGQLGTMTWAEWKKINENIISLIRAFDTETIPLVAGFDWAYDLSPLHDDPVNAEGIGYVSHPYENKRSQPWEPKWEENFGFAASKYPVVVTEFGFGLRPGQTINAEHYGNRIINYLEGKGIGWICWVYDPEWGPAMLKSWDTYELTGNGDFFKKAMHGELAVQKD